MWYADGNQTYRTDLAQYVVDAVPFMNSAQQTNIEMVLEGANALLLGKKSSMSTEILQTAKLLGRSGLRNIRRRAALKSVHFR